MSATVPLDPTMAAIDGYRLVLADLAATIAANWQGTIDRTDPEFLHDLRIAVRRSRTVLANGSRVLPAAVLAPARDEFGRLAALTSAPRDLDVYLLEWPSYIAPLGPTAAALLEPVRAVIARRRLEAHLELERGLRSERATALLRAWQVWLAAPIGAEDLPRRASGPLGELVAKRIDRAHRRLLEHGRLVGSDGPSEQLHALRKDAKKLRYLLECFDGLVGKRARKRHSKRLKSLQDTLGEHQDAEVHLRMLRAIAREVHAAGASADTMVAIGQLIDRLDQQRVAARAEFAQRFAEYDTPSVQRAVDAMIEGITA